MVSVLACITGALVTHDVIKAGLAGGAYSGAGASKTGNNIRVGSKVRIWLELEAKGTAYFKGVCPEFGQFGE
jgi:hypothetical protein